jgi:hypothetical protein
MLLYLASLSVIQEKFQRIPHADDELLIEFVHALRLELSALQELYCGQEFPSLNDII